MIADFINKSEKSERAFEQAIKDREMQSIVSKEKGDRLIIENQQEAEEAFTSQERSMY